MKRIIPLIVLSMLVMVGCKTTYLQQSTNVSNQKKSYDKLLIVHYSDDKTARIMLENQIVSDLKVQGVNATSSIQVIKTESFEKELSDAELDQLVESLLNNGYTGIVITNILDESQYTDVIPGNVYPTYYGGFDSYWGYYPATYREPDRIRTGVQYILESCLFDIKDNDGDNLQWVGRFKLKDPNDLQKAVTQYSAELTEALMANSIAN